MRIPRFPSGQIRSIGCFVLLSLLVGTTAWATNEQYTNFVNRPNFTTGEVLTVEDARYTYMLNNPSVWPNEFVNQSVTNRVILSVNHEDPQQSATAYNASVDVSITVYYVNGTNTIVNKTLTLFKTLAGEYTDKLVFELPNPGYKMDIGIAPKNAADAAEYANYNLQVEGVIEVERYDQFDPFFIPTGITSAYNATKGELEVKWPVIPGAEGYELEWSHYYSASSTDYPAFHPNAMRTNSTRVTTTGQSYFIPMLYDAGFIVYRVRARGRVAADNYASEIIGRWSSNAFIGACTSGGTVDCIPHKYYFSGHEEVFNWQSSISYIEGGKRKESISYYDGSLRSRQSQSKIESDQRVVVGESIYDYAGRAAVEVLPAPILSERIEHRSNFNQSLTSEPFYAGDFDADPATGACLPSPSMMSTQSGASRYYSPNGFTDFGIAEVPDAEGHPYSQTVFTPDNTGRVKSASGIGLNHAIGSTHENKAFYGKPFQEELDMLFGSEAGYSEFYQKTVNQDANGQLTVTYTDLAGNVVATGLEGTAPTNMVALPYATTYALSIDLMNKKQINDYSGSGNQLSADGRTREVNTRFVLSSEGQLDFNYEVGGTSYSDICEVQPGLGGEVLPPLTGPICYECIYDLTLSLTDECGEEHLVYRKDVGDPLGTTTTIGSAVLDQLLAGSYPIDGTCPSEAPPTLNTDTDLNFPLGGLASNDGTNKIMLPVGAYTVNKKLTINQQALDLYTEEYLENQNCVLPLQHFVDKAFLEIDPFGCTQTCDQCYQQAQDYASDNGYDATQTAALLAKCDEFCDNSNSPCTSAYAMLLADVTPNGQYGRVSPGTGNNGGNIVNGGQMSYGSANPAPYPLSVFNLVNVLPRKNLLLSETVEPNWRHPMIRVNSSTYVQEYQESDGSLSYILLQEVSTGVYEPAITGSPVMLGGVPYARPQDLTNLSDFLDYWRPSWAQSLVIYHPEFPYYVECLSRSTSNDYDTKVGTTPYSELLVDNLHLVPTSMSSSQALSQDPYFQSAPAIERNAMAYFMENFAIKDPSGSPTFYTIYDVAKILANTPTGLSFTDCDDTPPNPNTSALTQSEWEFFRGLYISLKQKFLTYRDRIRAINRGFYNGCISAEDFDPFRHGFFANIAGINNTPLINHYGLTWPSTPVSQFYNIEQPCNYATFALYENKVPRFGTVAQYLNSEDHEEGGCDHTTGGSLGEFANIHQTCQSFVESYTDEMSDEVAATFLRECGLCPVAKDLENLLNAFADPAQNGLSTVSGIHNLSCQPGGSPYLVYTRALDDGLFQNPSAFDEEQTSTWEVSSASGNELSGTFAKGNSDCVLKMQMVGANAGQYTIADIQSFCCITYAESSTSYSYTAGRNFTITAIVDDGNGGTDRVLMEGVTTCLDLKSCEPDIRNCKPTATSRQLQRLLNGLLYSGGGISAQLLSGNNVDLSAGMYRLLLNNGLYSQLHQLLGSSPADLAQESLIWNSSLSGSELTANVRNASGNKCDLTINFGSANPLLVTRIFRIEPHPQSPLHFTAQVEIVNGSSISYAQITGSSSCLDFGVCIPVGKDVASDTETAQEFPCDLTPYGQALNPYAQIPSGTLGGLYTLPQQSGCQVYVEVPQFSGRQKNQVVSTTALQADPTYVEPDGTTKHGYFFLEFADGARLRVRVWSDCNVLATCRVCYYENLVTNGELEVIGSGNSVSGITVDAAYTENTNLQTLAVGTWTANSYGMISDATVGATYPLFDHTVHSIYNGSYLGFAISGNSNTAIWKETFTVQPNQDYPISAWVARLTEESEEPSLELWIDGVLIESVVVDEQAGVWQQISFVWNSGSNTSVNVELRPQTASGGAVQKMALDDIEFGLDCPRLLSTPVEHVINGDFENNMVGFTHGPFSDDCDCAVESICVGAEARDKCGSADWIDDLWDHTFGNSTGHYLIVDGFNAGIGTSFTFWSTNVTVMQDEVYTFSFWYMPTVSTGNNAQVEMYVNGSQVGNTITGISSTWSYNSVAWVANQTGTITIELKQVNGLGGSGNDFGVDDISFVGPKPYKKNRLICDLQPSPTITEPDPCWASMITIAEQNGELAYEAYLEDKRAEFQRNYIETCMNTFEKFEMDYSLTTARQYTLYYYDQSNNLVRTVPPQGVTLTTDPASLAQIKTDRANGIKVFNDSHSKGTTYHYNSLNQLVEQTSPDVDNFSGENYANRMWYDKLGRLAASQTSEQRPQNRYNYTLYDDLGRMVEAGEIHAPSGIAGILNAQQQVEYDLFKTWLITAPNQRYEVASTYYDAPATGTPFAQENLRNRIASTTYEEVADLNNPATYDHATHYSYDIHGNVKLLVQDLPELEKLDQRYKVLEYTYDLISGNVREVAYQRDEVDQFYHRYTYDADNRIQHVYASSDGIVWDEDARYAYYPHGPLQRKELGQLKVQGQDYAYTIQGWIKGVNSNLLTPDTDPGGDGALLSTQLNKQVAADEMGYSLGYFHDGSKLDYNPVGTTSFLADLTGSALLAQTTDRSLYNGNINHMITSIGHFMERGEAPTAMRYHYDQLNRLKEMRLEDDFNAGTNQWGPTAMSVKEYAVDVIYDKDGNISELTRNGTTQGGNPLAMDAFTYAYQAGRNQLDHVKDGVSAVNYAQDLDEQLSGNYQYDAEGNLIEDVSEEIKEIRWTAAGKVKYVERTTGSASPDLEFRYNALGDRIAKIVKPRDTGTGKIKDQSHWIYTYYQRDASGNPMAVYERTWEDLGSGTYREKLEVSEQQLYGSNRLGVRNALQTTGLIEYTATVNSTTQELEPGNITDVLPVPPADVAHRRGAKSYELSNHLGNVLTVVSDRKVVEEEDLWLEDDFTTLHPGWLGNASLFNGQLQVTTTSQFAAAVRDIPVKPNTMYTLKLDVDRGTSNDCMVVIQEMPSGNPLYGITFFFNQNYEASFMTHATTNKIRLRVQRNDPTSAGSVDFYVDNIELIEKPHVYGEEFGTVGANWNTVSTASPSTTDIQVDNVNRMRVSTKTIGDAIELPLTGLDPGKTYIVRAQIQPLGSLYNLRFKLWNNGSWSMDQHIPLVWGAYWTIPIQIAPGTNSAIIRLERDVPGTNTLEFIVGEFLIIHPGREKAEVVAANDYYPFGMQMPTRSHNSPNYRYGFNGMEKDDEVNIGSGNSYDYGFRIYNPRISRFLSVDPLTSSFPYYTPYQFAGNQPIWAIDLDGLEEYIVHHWWSKDRITRTKIRYVKHGDNIINQNHPDNVNDKNVIIINHQEDGSRDIAFTDEMTPHEQERLKGATRDKSTGGTYVTFGGDRVNGVESYSVEYTIPLPRVKPSPTPSATPPSTTPPPVRRTARPVGGTSGVSEPHDGPASTPKTEMVEIDVITITGETSLSDTPTNRKKLRDYVQNTKETLERTGAADRVDYDESKFKFGVKGDLFSSPKVGKHKEKVPKE